MSDIPVNGGVDRPLPELSLVAEALIFGSDEPIGAERIADVFAEVRGEGKPSKSDVDSAIDVLNEVYEQSGHAMRVFRWAEGYRMATVQDVAPYLKAFLDQQRSRRLSRSLMEALAVVAYKQPVTKPEVDFVRGVDSDYALRKLMELDMVDVIGRSDAVGRPLLYGTTRTFLEKFGMKNLDALPNLREVEELLSDPAFNSEKAKLLLRQSLGGPAGEASDDATSADDLDGSLATNGTDSASPEDG